MSLLLDILTCINRIQKYSPTSVIFCQMCFICYLFTYNVYDAPSYGLLTKENGINNFPYLSV